jgi:hypothetical protein
VNASNGNPVTRRLLRWWLTPPRPGLQRLTRVREDQARDRIWPAEGQQLDQDYASMPSQLPGRGSLVMSSRTRGSAKSRKSAI